MGIKAQAVVNASRFFNIRAPGNYFSYNVSNVTINNGGGSNGISVSGNLKFATAGASLDIYPFPNHGFRLSPGAVFYNQNRAGCRRCHHNLIQLHLRLANVLL